MSGILRSFSSWLVSTGLSRGCFIGHVVCCNLGHEDCSAGVYFSLYKCFNLSKLIPLPMLLYHLFTILFSFSLYFICLWCPHMLSGELFTAQALFVFLQHPLEKLLQPHPFLWRLLQNKLLESVRRKARSSCCCMWPKGALHDLHQNTGWCILYAYYTACIWHAVIAVLWQPVIQSWGCLLQVTTSGLLCSTNTSALFWLWISGEVMTVAWRTASQGAKRRLMRKVIAQASTS